MGAICSWDIWAMNLKQHKLYLVKHVLSCPYSTLKCYSKFSFLKTPTKLMSRISWSDFKTAISEKLHNSLDFSCFLGLLLTKWWWWRQLLKGDFQREPLETRGSTLPGQRHSWLPGPTLSHRRGTGRLSQHSAWMMSGLVTPPSYSGWSMIRTASAYLGLKGHFSIYELQPHSYQSLKSCCLNCLKLTWLHHLTQAGQWSWQLQPI